MTVIDSEKVCIFIPFAGGSGLSFEALRRAVGTCMPVIGVTYKGRYQKNVTQAPGTVDAMASEVIALINSLAAHEVIIFGYSLGAIVAYEVARRQHEFTPRLTRLVVAACRAPQLFNCAQVALDDTEDVFVQTVSTFGAIPDFMLKHSAAKSRMLPSLIKDFQVAALYRYVPGDPLDIPMLVLGGSEDPFAPVQDVVSWASHSHDVVRVAFFEGNHFFLTQHIPAITQMLTEPDSLAVPLSVSFPYPDTSARI
ncbi:MAG: alpha/beta fold hydrolase [Pseudomonas sp.]